MTAPETGNISPEPERRDPYQEAVNRNANGGPLSDDEVWLYGTMGRRLESSIAGLVLDSRARAAGRRTSHDTFAQTQVRALTGTLRRLDQGPLLELVKTHIRERFRPLPREQR